MRVRHSGSIWQDKKDNIKMDLGKTGPKGVGWIHLTHNKDQWRSHVTQ
jgi:hypothetical protein